MHVFWWIVISACFMLSFAGLVIPVLPGVALIWVGVVIYQFFINTVSLSWLTWMSLGLLTVILLITDEIANHYFVKRAGGSKKGSLAAMLGLILGVFVVPPFGVIIVPFILVLLTEIGQQRTVPKALDIALSTVIAFFGGTVAKVFLQLIMIVIFFMDVVA